MDGVYRLFSLSAVPVLNDDGSIRSWVGVHHDITERRKREDEILAQEAKFRFLSDTMPQIVWTARPDGGRDYFNRRWFDYTGMTFDQSEGLGWMTALHPDDVQNCIRVWNRSLATDEPYQCEYRFKHAGDGLYRWHLGRADALKDAHGVLVRWFGTCTDIDNYKTTEAENLRLRSEMESRVHQATSALEETNAELKSSSRMLELSNGVLQDFASVAAHDLQEPLRKVQAFGDRLKKGYDTVLDRQGQDYLDRMLNAANRMQTLIQDLLAFSRVTSQGRAFVAVDLASVTREVLSDLEVRITETAALVEVGNLPLIEGDPVQIRQLLQNLLGNSLKFHNKEVRPVVRIHMAASSPDDGGFCRLVVEDNGIGFDEKYLDRIFAVFQRLHGRNEYEGTGVGLAICRKIAQRHGGEITATSAPGRGSAFVVTLPRHVPELLQPAGPGFSGAGLSSPQRDPATIDSHSFSWSQRQ